ncbi:hypothetical protein GEMRC1_009990 [Eukaryota sp. GEM-RC1]
MNIGNSLFAQINFFLLVFVLIVLSFGWFLLHATLLLSGERLALAGALFVVWWLLLYSYRRLKAFKEDGSLCIDHRKFSFKFIIGLVLVLFVFAIKLHPSWFFSFIILFFVILIIMNEFYIWKNVWSDQPLKNRIFYIRIVVFLFLAIITLACDFVLCTPKSILQLRALFKIFVTLVILYLLKLWFKQCDDNDELSELP